MGESRQVDFDALPWEDEAPGIRSRAIRFEGSRWALVEYAQGASREEWCTEGHRGYVLRGAIEYEFDDGREPLTLGEGDAFRLGTGAGHRGRNLADGPTHLFLIDDPA